MTHNIRFATPGDAKELLDIYAPYVETTAITFEYDVPSVEEFTQRIETISQSYPYLVYLVDGEIAGYAYASTFRTRAAFMWDVETSVYVKPEFHQKKVAAKLYEALLSLLTKQGFYNCYAYISVPNPKSTHFHEKFGFTEIASYPDTGFKLGQWCSLSCMHKELNPIITTEAPKPFLTIHKLDQEFIRQTLQSVL
ncbi:MAG: GNAT family N-acetyltransferase [bacterium]|nr:GNAT family N-acetyltransferase [bacterium]